MPAVDTLKESAMNPAVYDLKKNLTSLLFHVISAEAGLPCLALPYNLCPSIPALMVHRKTIYALSVDLQIKTTKSHKRHL